MALAVNRVTSANVYYDGNSLLGKAESFTLTELPFVMSEHKALGALGTTQYFAAIDKIEAEMVVTSHYPDLIKLLADPTTSKQMQVRGNLQTQESTGLTAEVPLVYFITATPMNLPVGDFKAQENSPLTYKLSITAKYPVVTFFVIILAQGCFVAAYACLMALIILTGCVVAGGSINTCGF